jgi:Fur family ferric uptake transcriptional regulator
MKDVVENFSTHLRKGRLRLTEERRKLLHLILSLPGHFSPEDIISKVKEKSLPISRATTYRILPVLVEAGFIQQSLFSSEGKALFEVTWNRAHHDHLICTQCKKIIEFKDNAIELLQREVANKYGFVLEHHVMELMGSCRECRKGRC